MLCLSGFELYSRWVPLFCYNVIQGQAHYEASLSLVLLLDCFDRQGHFLKEDFSLTA